MEYFKEAPLTMMLIVLNVVISFMGFSNSKLVDKLIMWPYYVKRKKEYYRFISSGFLHADWVHLFFNMFTLFFFGTAIEHYFEKHALGGKIAYLLLYFLALIISDITSYIKHKDNFDYRSLGASGAVCAVLFATLVFAPWAQLQLYGVVKISFTVYAVLFLIYCINMGKKSMDNVNHDAHLWGSLFGLAFTIVLIWTLNPALFDLVLKEFASPSLFGRAPKYID